MKIAMFKNLILNYACVWDEEHQPFGSEWLRTTGWLEVELPPLSEKEQEINDELIALHNRQRAFEDDFHRQRKTLQEERERLKEQAA